MFGWAEIVLLFLRLANAIMGAVNQDKWMRAGQDAEIAEISASIMRKTAAGKAIMEKVNAMPEAEVDAGLRGLEPK